MYQFDEERHVVLWRREHEVLELSAPGQDSVRVRCALYRLEDDIPHGLVEAPAGAFDEVQAGSTLVAVSGRLEIRGDERGSLTFVDRIRGEELLAESANHNWWPGSRYFSSTGNGYYRIEQRFRGYDGEKLFGFGQRTHGRLDHKGMVIDLVQRNAEVSIPFALSDRGYGFLWNSPAVGRAELMADSTRWVADSARQIDYVVVAGETPRDIMGRYTELVGRAPALPEWASGFWQSKLRYRTQEELLTVVREHRRRGLPMSVVVADFFHWTHVGDYQFDPEEFPDPKAMVDELTSYGIKLMVSVWPTVSPLSINYDEMREKGYLIGTERGIPYLTEWGDKGLPRRLPVTFYDSTNPEARRFVWSRVSENYKALGIGIWWLDACEPEIKPSDPANMRLYAGIGSEVMNIYPQAHASGFYDGMRSEGEDEILLLCRSAWVGSQRYGAAVWSGDIDTTFDSLARQIRAGLSIGIAGIPWWTTDIGGFHGGHPDSPEYRELMIRWFQFGVFCPLFRLHGHRDPRGSASGSTARPDTLGPQGWGGDNEVWSFGEEAYGIITELLFLRERLRPYVMAQMAEASATGVPPMRPLFMQYPDDPRSWEVEDQFFFGPDLLVAPVTEYGARSREVYLPAGTRWRDAWTGDLFEGGQSYTMAAPLDRIPVLMPEASPLSLAAPES
jgi:alpha-D-xyloside xylohydrolase